MCLSPHSPNIRRSTSALASAKICAAAIWSCLACLRTFAIYSAISFFLSIGGASYLKQDKPAEVDLPGFKNLEGLSRVKLIAIGGNEIINALYSRASLFLEKKVLLA